MVLLNGIELINKQVKKFGIISVEKWYKVSYFENSCNSSITIKDKAEVKKFLRYLLTK